MKASSRYCIRGEQCTQYARLDEPSKLRSSSESSVCEACLSAEADAESERASPVASTSARTTKSKPPTRPRREKAVDVLASSAEAEIRGLKRELVLSLFKQSGAFWDLVRKMRERWDVTPEARVPPSATGPLDLKFPLRTPNPFIPKNWPDPYEDRNKSFDLTISWAADIREVQKQMVPEKYQDKGAPGEMDRFFSACVLYDPPENELLEFAEISDPEPEAFFGSQMPDEVEDPGKLPRMVTPPVKTLQELTQSEDWAWDCLMYDHGERLRSLMESWGIDTYQLLTELERDDPELRERYLRKVKRDESRYFIEVDEHTTKDDIDSAFRLIRSAQEKRGSGGRPSRNPLVAVQCAIHYKQPEWTYKKLADHFSLGSTDTAKRYVEEGQKILEEN